MIETINNADVVAGEEKSYRENVVMYLNYKGLADGEVLVKVKKKISSIKDLTRSIEELSEKSNASPSFNLHNLNVFCTGDSITAGQTLANAAASRWNAQLATKYNWNITVKAVGGAAVSSNADQKTCIVKFIDDLATIETKPDLIFIWGGHNDIAWRAAPFGNFEDMAEEDASGALVTKANKNTFCGGLRYCAEVAHYYAPNAKIFFLTMLNCNNIKSGMKMKLSPDKTVFDMNMAIKEAGLRYACGVIDMGMCGINSINGIQGNMTNDGIHPSVKGTTQIVNFLVNYLEKNFIKTIDD